MEEETASSINQKKNLVKSVKMAGKNQKKKEKPLEDESSSKKKSMKTATDVISRLQWDSSLPKEKFFVGYLDRFDGIIEKPFTSLDWRDPSIVDNYTLALPKHRIQYFKYLNKKVWDKATRKDIVFGSTGYPQSILEFMDMVDQDILQFQDEDVEPIMFPISSDVISETHDDDQSDEEYDMSDRSNFFIAARILEDNTVSNIEEVSDNIKSKDELLAQCCMDPKMFHLTLAILKLDSPGDVCNAIAAMKAVSELALPSVTLELDSLEDFEHRVLYTRVEKNEDLVKLRNYLVDELLKSNVNITDKYKFVPHVTIAKLSRRVSRLRHSNFIDQYLYLKFEDNYFGKQVIDKLYLCEMGAAQRDDGFYKCAFEVSV